MKVLILGGYGVFGGRLARLLLEDGIEVIVAGRDAGKAAAFTAQYGGTPLGIGIGADLSPIAEAAPALVVDAAGPFQAYGSDPYRLAWFCIGNKIAYLDFSDDAAFTAGIAALDQAARAAGCFALSGVSSVPAISAAAVRALSEGLSGIEADRDRARARQPRAARALGDPLDPGAGRRTAGGVARRSVAALSRLGGGEARGVRPRPQALGEPDRRAGPDAIPASLRRALGGVPRRA